MAQYSVRVRYTYGTSKLVNLSNPTSGTDVEKCSLSSISTARLGCNRGWDRNGGNYLQAGAGDWCYQRGLCIMIEIHENLNFRAAKFV